jgi:hypothetical protein
VVAGEGADRRPRPWDADDPGGVGVGRVWLSRASPPGISPPRTVGPVTGTPSGEYPPQIVPHADRV